VAVSTKTKYMNIHSTIQYNEHYKTQETENTEKQKIHEKHIHKTLENTKKHRKYYTRYNK
jgi:hypothetical protein